MLHQNYLNLAKESFCGEGIKCLLFYSKSWREFFVVGWWCSLRFTSPPIPLRRKGRLNLVNCKRFLVGIFFIFYYKIDNRLEKYYRPIATNTNK